MNINTTYIRYVIYRIYAKVLSGVRNRNRSQQLTQNPVKIVMLKFYLSDTEQSMLEDSSATTGVVAVTIF
jgi:hypothetical protein